MARIEMRDWRGVLKRADRRLLNGRVLLGMYRRLRGRASAQKPPSWA
jgi:hypothetical protein